MVEILVVVAIIGILAAIAVPAYSDYTVRARVSEILLFASAPKRAIEEQCHQNNACSSIGGIVVQSSALVAGGSVTPSGALVISGKPALGTVGFHVSMMPSWTGKTVAWTCSTSMPNLAPSSCRD